MTEENKNDHVTIKIPIELVQEIDQRVGTSGYRSRAEITKQALREFMQRNPLPKIEKILPRFEHLNMDATGAKIIDRQTKRIANIIIIPQGMHCDICDEHQCVHIDFALTVPDIQEVIREKLAEGWKLPKL
jgi:metal-responsive CopG/Arc/MetJ family transcriptional regulator